MITSHMLARSRERRPAPRLAHDITLRSRELARREARHGPPAAIPCDPAPCRPPRAVRAGRWARALLA